MVDFGGVQLEMACWVHAVGGQHALNLLDLSRRILLPMDQFGFYDGDLDELFHIFGGPDFEKVFRLTEEEEIEKSRQYLNDYNSFVVIHGLRSTDDWDAIKSNFISFEITRCCCFVVVTDDPDVASYCVDDDKERLVRVRYADVGMVCAHLLAILLLLLLY